MVPARGMRSCHLATRGRRTGSQDRMPPAHAVGVIARSERAQQASSDSWEGEMRLSIASSVSSPCSAPCHSRGPSVLRSVRGTRREPGRHVPGVPASPALCSPWQDVGTFSSGGTRSACLTLAIPLANTRRSARSGAEARGCLPGGAAPPRPRAVLRPAGPAAPGASPRQPGSPVAQSSASDATHGGP